MQIQAHLKPNTKHRESIAINNDGSLTIFTKSPAVDGKANVAAIKLIAKHFKVNKTRVTLVAGFKSKLKVFEVDLP